MLLRSLSFVLLAGISLSACAQTAPSASQEKAGAKPKVATPAVPAPKVVEGTPSARAMAALKKLNPQIAPEQIADAPIPGFQQAIVGGQVVYISNDGKYLMQGALYDIDAQKNLGEAAMAGVRRKLLDDIPERDRIVFAPANPKHIVVVFTDVECGYCRKMHSEIADYNKQGIAVEYVAFPRMGPASEDFRKMEAVWCAKDRRKALTDAKNDRKVARVTCTSPVMAQFNAGQRAGLSGTPMILSSDGTQFGGYLPPAELRAALDKHVADAVAAKSTAGAGT